MSSQAYVRDTCRLCGKSGLELALRLEATPIGDHFVPAERCNQVQETYPLDLMLCPDCGNAQLHDIVDPDVIYPEFIYTTSVSLGLVEHFQAYADALLLQVNPSPGSLVVEIGSNEGAMLRPFGDRGFRTLGVDPAREIARRATEAGIETLPTYFTTELAHTIRQERGPAAIVIATNTMANIDEFSGAMEGVRTLLAPDGVFVFETSYLLDVVEKSLVDTIFHEHLSYFSVRPLQQFFRRCGMELLATWRISTKGGSLRGMVQLAGGPRPVEKSVAEFAEREAQAGLGRVEGFAKMAHDLQRLRGELCAKLRGWKAEGKTVAAYGAAVGLTTMIYHFHIGGLIDFIVDDNPAKHHLYSPGLHLPALPSQALYDRRPDYVVVLAWRYIEAIARRHRGYLAGGGRFVLPLPEICLIGDTADGTV